MCSVHNEIFNISFSANFQLTGFTYLWWLFATSIPSSDYATFCWSDKQVFFYRIIMLKLQIKFIALSCTFLGMTSIKARRRKTWVIWLATFSKASSFFFLCPSTSFPLKRRWSQSSCAINKEIPENEEKTNMMTSNHVMSTISKLGIIIIGMMITTSLKLSALPISAKGNRYNNQQSTLCTRAKFSRNFFGAGSGQVQLELEKKVQAILSTCRIKSCLLRCP